MEESSCPEIMSLVNCCCLQRQIGYDDCRCLISVFDGSPKATEIYGDFALRGRLQIAEEMALQAAIIFAIMSTTIAFGDNYEVKVITYNDW